jgi:hypothetical protein
MPDGVLLYGVACLTFEVDALYVVSLVHGARFGLEAASVYRVEQRGDEERFMVTGEFRCCSDREPDDRSGRPSRAHPGNHVATTFTPSGRALRRVIDGEAPCGPYSLRGQSASLEISARRAPALAIPCPPYPRCLFCIASRPMWTHPPKRATETPRGSNRTARPGPHLRQWGLASQRG